MKHILRKLVYSAFLLILSGMITLPVRAADYTTSQYCLQGYRAQFALDQRFPEYANLCGDGATFTGNIGDPELYELAGDLYLTGASPTALNWELQPLGKYLIGVSRRLTGSGQMITVGAGIGALILLVLIARQGGLSWRVASVPSLLLALDALFRAHLFVPYLDMQVTFWATLSLYLLGRAWKAYPLIMIVLAALALTKSFSLGAVAWGAGVIYLCVAHPGEWRRYLKATLLIPPLYLLGYSAFFRTHSLADFLDLHILIIKFYRAYLPEYPWGEVWRTLTVGEWRSWWGDKGLLPVPEYSWLWPLATLGWIIAMLRYAARRQPTVLLHSIWIGMYLLFASVRLVFPRYLLPVLPSLYYLLVFELGSIIRGWHSHFFRSISKPTGIST